MSDPHQFHRIVGDVLQTPWALLPSALDAMLSVLQVRATGQRVSEEEVRAAIATREAREPVRGVQRGVALLPVFGILGQRMNLPLQMSGGTSTEILSRDFRQLLDDDRVSAIVLACDSPGGSTHGVGELATEIRTAREQKRKPVVACVSSLCASAAYWIASGAERIVITPGGDAGSVGVICAHEDFSGAQERAGIKTTLISAGRFKAEANPFQPLTDEARANLQRRVDECYRRFVAAVAAGRGVSEHAVREGYGQGRLLGAREALAAGMVDEIATLDEVITDLAEQTMSSRVTRSPREAARRQEPAALDDWQRRVALDLRLLDL